ncbi:MAG: biotin carboxylase N-terminal domain-containing protein [Oleispira sp.]
MNSSTIKTPTIKKASITKILIANRGEIACRIIHTAKKMGIQTVAVYSTADAQSKYVQLADEAIWIGEATPKDSYLRGQNIIQAAKDSGAQAIHPGYGFLSENAPFSKLCDDNQIIFIGPPASAMEAMGLKAQAKIRMEAANVPLVPGYHGEDQSVDRIKQACIDIGFPVLLKASAGGGGKGMRVVESLAGIEDDIAGAQREGLNSFGDSHLLAEKYLARPRHIEIQLFCDQQGNGVYLFERDCSIQRRHQKIVEEAPAPNFPESVRKAMGEAALKAAHAIGYVGAGTVEFLYENGEFYFMEMNTRLQVEHPISEYITGQDLVAWQIKVAAGEPLPITQDDLKINGHAIEVRLYAEDPDNGFLPTAGKIDDFIYPQASSFSLDYEQGVRMDTGVDSGDEVSPFYDPMIAKLIVWGKDRSTAIRKLKNALHHTHITGLTTNVRYLEKLIGLESFELAQLDTHFVEDNAEAIKASRVLSDQQQQLHQIFAAWFLYRLRLEENGNNTIQSNDVHSPWKMKTGWRLNSSHSDPIVLLTPEESRIQIQPLPSGNYSVLMGEQRYIIQAPSDLTVSSNSRGLSSIDLNSKDLSLIIKSIDANSTNKNSLNQSIKAQVLLSGDKVQVHSLYGSTEFIRPSRLTISQSEEENDHGLHAPMNGCLTEVRVQAGDAVASGDILVIMEAMKMEHTIKAPHDGTIAEIFFKQGDLIDEGREILSFLDENEA